MLSAHTFGTLLALLAVTGALATGSLAIAQTATFTGLEPLPNHSFSTAKGVSGDGNVVVGYSSGHSDGDCSDNCQAIRWTNGGAPISLGFLPGSNASEAHAANADGSVIVGLAHETTAVHSERAFRWVQDSSPAGGTMSALPLTAGRSCASAEGVSVDGSVVVGTGNTCGSGSPYEAFRWTNGVSTGLGFFPGYNGRFYGTGISPDGTTVTAVAGDDATQTGQGVRWKSGVKLGLGFLQGDTGSTAFGASFDGSIVTGHSCNGPAETCQTYRWVKDSSATSGTMTALPLLEGGTYSFGRGISADGSVIVGHGNSTTHPGGNGEAFRWTASEGTVSIRQLLTNAGVDVSGWTLTLATSVSADGTLIVGDGTDPSGQKRGWVASFRQEVCPTENQGIASCVGKCNSYLAHEYGDYSTAAASLGYSSVQALQDKIKQFCRLG